MTLGFSPKYLKLGCFGVVSLMLCSYDLTNIDRILGDGPEILVEKTIQNRRRADRAHPYDVTGSEEDNQVRVFLKNTFYVNVK